MPTLTRRSLLAAAAATLASPKLAAPALAQTPPVLRSIRSTAKSWLWLVEDYANGAGLFRRDRPYCIRQRETMPVILTEAMGLRLDDLHLVHGRPGQAAVPQRQHVHAIEGAQVVDQRLPHDFAIV